MAGVSTWLEEPLAEWTSWDRFLFTPRNTSSIDMLADAWRTGMPASVVTAPATALPPAAAVPVVPPVAFTQADSFPVAVDVIVAGVVGVVAGGTPSEDLDVVARLTGASVGTTP